MNASLYIVLPVLSVVVAGLLFIFIEGYGLKVRERVGKVVSKYEGMDQDFNPEYKITARDIEGINVTYTVSQEVFQKTAINDGFRIAYKLTRIGGNAIPVKPSEDLPVII